MKAACLMPESEDALSNLIAQADRPFTIVGGGTRGITTEGTRQLSTQTLSGVTLYEPGALTLVAKAGTPLAEIETLLASEGQRLAFEPVDFRSVLETEGTPTVGGMVAANCSGPRRVTAGACRDFLLGVRFVDGTGRLISNGGRVMKNVTGYDLVKLMGGSWGCLGVLTEISLKVLPAPETTGVLLINDLDEETAVKVLSYALGSPYEVTGAAHLPEGRDGHPVTMIRVEGFEGSVDYRLKRLRERLMPFGDVILETDPDKTKAGWSWVRDMKSFQGRAGNLWRLSLKPSDAPRLVAQLKPSHVSYDWGGGRVTLLLPDEVDPRIAMSDLDGHATLLRGSGFARLHPEAPAVAAITKALRQKFDPRGLFNPGLMD